MATDGKDQEKLMLAALAVKRGERKLDDMPKDEREKVRGVLRSTGESKMAQFARSTYKTPARTAGSRAPQRHIRRARSA